MVFRRVVHPAGGLYVSCKLAETAVMLRAAALSRSDLNKNIDLLMSLHRLRSRVFKCRLNWHVTIAGDMEIDNYDALNPTYIVVIKGENEVIGHVRFLPTTGPNMLANTFPVLLEGRAPPCAPAIIESSRFCVDTEETISVARNGTRIATQILLASMQEWALSQSYAKIATVTDIRMERILRRSGWPLERLGKPRDIDGTIALAGYLDVSAAVAVHLRQAAGYATPLLGPSGHFGLAA